MQIERLPLEQADKIRYNWGALFFTLRADNLHNKLSAF